MASPQNLGIRDTTKSPPRLHFPRFFSSRTVTKLHFHTLLVQQHLNLIPGLVFSLDVVPRPEGDEKIQTDNKVRFNLPVVTIPNPKNPKDSCQAW